MRNIVLSFFLIIPSLCYSAPRNINPTTPNQVWQNDLDLTDSIKTNIGQSDSLTLAQIRTTTARRKGKQYFCTDCATAAICVSTGTTVGQFSSISGRTTACN